MKSPANSTSPGLDLIPRRSIYLIGLLAAVKALGLVLLAEAIARGVSAIASGGDWRPALVLGFAAGLLRAGATWATSVAAAYAALDTKESIRARLADRLMDGTSQPGSMSTLATRGLDDLDEYFASVLPAMTGAAVIPLLVGIRILTADWLSALIVLLTVPLVPVFMVLVGQYTQVRTDAAASALDRLSDHIVELARGLPVLVGLGRMDEQAAALRRISDDYRKTTMATLRVAFLSSLVLELIATISVAVVAVSVGIRILGGGMTLEVGLIALILAPECYAPLRDLGAAFHASRAGKSALARVSGILSAPARDSVLRTVGALGVDNLTVSFPDRPVFDALNFRLPATGVTALLGASGSGKSTLLRALAGRLDDDAIATGTVHGFSDGLVGWAPQHPHTVADTVWAELTLYAVGIPGGGSAELESLIERLSLSAVADTDPAQLSPGELRRVAVARALLRVDAGATVLLLDEPTAHLDDASAGAVIDLVQRAALRASVIVASHDAAILAISGNRLQLGMPAGQRQRAAAAETAGPVSAANPTPDDASAPTQHPLTALTAFVRPALGRYVGAAALGTFASAFAIALTTVSAWLIVRASEGPAIMYLLVAIVGVRFFGLGRAALRYCERLVTHDAVLSSATELRARLWRSLASVGTGSRRLQRGGTALDYLVGATDDIRDLVPRIVVPVAVGVSVGLAALLAAWLILPAAAGVLLVLLVAAILLAPAVALASDRASESAQQQARGGVLRRFAAMLDAADDLRGNGADGPIRSELRLSDQAIGALGRRVAASRGLGAALVVLAGCLGTVGMLAVGAQAVAAGVIPVELAAVLVLLPVALVEPLAGLVSAVQHWPALVTALRKADGLTIPATPSGCLLLPVRVGELRLESVSARWPGASRDAFCGVTARVRPGQWLVVEGPSGSGKSTLLTALLGGIQPSAGRLLFDELEIGELDPVDMRRHVAWCPQDAHLFDSTLRGNLLLGRARDDAPTDTELHEAMRAAGLGRVLASLPLGLDTRIGSQGSHFSGGERQRIAVARTLLSRTGIVLLDEPTAHLDEGAATQLMADLRAAFSDRIVVLVTHHTEELEPGDELLVLGEQLLGERSPAFA